MAESAAMLVLMRQEISSAWTVVFKLFVPLILIAISIVLIAILLAYPNSVNSQALIVVSLTLAATAFFVWWSRKLKRVSFDEQNLYVSNLTKEICVPLVEIDSVEEFQGGAPVILRLKTKSTFGRTIFFIAKLQLSTFGNAQSSAEELRQIVKSINLSGR